MSKFYLLGLTRGLIRLAASLHSRLVCMYDEGLEAEVKASAKRATAADAALAKAQEAGDRLVQAATAARDALVASAVDVVNDAHEAYIDTYSRNVGLSKTLTKEDNYAQVVLGKKQVVAVIIG